MKSSGSRKRTKTYSGCLNCRERKVKCDERRPCCSKCFDARIPCSGYSVRLAWVESNRSNARSATSSSTDLSTSRGEPSATTAGRVFVPALPADTDADGPRGEPLFSVFPSAPATCTGTCLSPPISGADLNTDGVITCQSTHLPNQTVEEEAQQIWTTTVEHPTMSTSEGMKSVTQRQFDDSHVLQHQDEKSITEQHDQLALVEEPPRCRWVTHIDPLPLSSRQSQLIHHYVTSLSSRMVLIDSSENPCRARILSMAFRGLTSSAVLSSCELAIFHSICAASAYELYSTNTDIQTSDCALPAKHDYLASVHLKDSLLNVNAARDDINVGWAIVSYFLIESMAGCPGRWRTHLRGGLSYIAQANLMNTHQARDLIDLQRTLLWIAVLSGLEVPLDAMACFGETLGPHYESQGMPSRFIREVANINSMISHPHLYSEQDLETFELQLYSAYPSCQPSSNDPKEQRALHYMNLALYYARLVFFKRCARKAALHQVQALVGPGIHALETIDQMTGDTGGGGIMWPAIVLCAESDSIPLQTRARSWFNSKKRCGSRTTAGLLTAVSEVWRRRAFSNADVQWLNVLQEGQYDFLRL